MSLHYRHHLTLGFAGKRIDPKLAELKEPLKELFEAFDKKLKRNHIRLVTGFADGADLIAATLFSDLFLRPNARKHRSIGAILPFHEVDFKQTLTEAKSKELFEELYPLCDQQLELDGKYIAGDSEAANASNDEAYEQQGKVLSRLVDVLIAVTPHDASLKPGGTVKTFLSTLYLKKPVIHFDLKDGKFYLYQSVGDWLHDRKASAPEQIVEALFKLLPSSTKFQPETVREGGVFIFRKMAWVFYERYFRGKKKPGRPVLKQLAVLFGALFRKKKVIVPKLSTPEFASLDKLMAHQQELLDDAAQHFQFHYRGGYILNYFLALIAIFLAVCSIVVALESRRLVAAESIPWWLASIGIIKLAVIILLVVNTRRINKFKYNRKAIDYRYAAERLRINSYMGLLGFLRAPRPSLGNHSKRHFDKYVGEDMYQALMMEPLQKPFRKIITNAFLQKVANEVKTEWIGGQLNYHRGETSLMNKMDEHLEKIPAGLAITVLVVVAVDLLLGINIEIIHIQLCPLWLARFLAALPILLGLTAFLPAIVTTLNSIRFQSDAHRLAMRSGIMAEELEYLDARIDDVIHDLKTDETGSRFGAVLDIMEETACLMTDEVAEWSLIYEKRVFEQG